MITRVVLLSVCLHAISAAFDYIDEEHSFMGKKACGASNTILILMRLLELLSHARRCHQQQSSLQSVFTRELSLVSSTDPEEVLSVSIPLQEPQRPPLGSSLVLPCYFKVSNQRRFSHLIFHSTPCIFRLCWKPQCTYFKGTVHPRFKNTYLFLSPAELFTYLDCVGASSLVWEVPSVEILADIYWYII